MKKKAILIPVIVISLAVAVFFGSAIFSGIKDGMEKGKVKNQFTKAFNKIMEMDSQERDGSLKLDATFDSKEYGKFVSLLETEKNYYLELEKVEKSYEEFSKAYGNEMQLNTPEDIKKARETAKSINGFMDNYLNSVRNLNENNIKEIQGLDIPDNYKQLYISGKKEVNGAIEEYIGKLSVVMKGLSGDLTEVINIVERISISGSQAEAQKSLGKLDALTKKMESYDKDIESLDKAIGTKLDEVNKNFAKKIESIK